MVRRWCQSNGATSRLTTSPRGTAIIQFLTIHGLVSSSGASSSSFPPSLGFRFALVLSLFAPSDKQKPNCQWRSLWNASSNLCDTVELFSPLLSSPQCQQNPQAAHTMLVQAPKSITFVEDRTNAYNAASSNCRLQSAACSSSLNHILLWTPVPAFYRELLFQLNHK